MNWHIQWSWILIPNDRRLLNLHVSIIKFLLTIFLDLWEQEDIENNVFSELNLHEPVYKTHTSHISWFVESNYASPERQMHGVCDIIYCIIRVFPHCKAAISALCVISTMNYEFVAHRRYASCTKANSSNNKSNRKFSPLCYGSDTQRTI